MRTGFSGQFGGKNGVLRTRSRLVAGFRVGFAGDFELGEVVVHLLGLTSGLSLHHGGNFSGEDFG